MVDVVQQTSVPSYPMRRGACPLHPPPELAAMRNGPAARPVRLWDGSQVWLVTAYEHIRAVLGDRRFTAVTSAPGFPMMTRTSKLVRAQPQSASFIRMDDPEHSRLRSMLARDFLPRAVEEWRPRIRRLVEEMLTEIAASTPPVDLVATFALPLPSQVIAFLLDIPDDAHAFFQNRSAILIDRGYTPEQVKAAREDLDGYLRELVESRINKPGSDLVSRLVVNEVQTGRLTVEELVPMCRLLLVAGHGTTSSQAALNLLSLLTDENLSTQLRRDPTLVPGAVDELLRFHSIVQNGLARAATEDVQLGDTLIRAGEGVVLSLSAGNRDESRFPDPDTVDPRRDARRHLAFGHGVHQCLGQWLAKVELEEMLYGMLRLLPQARLAVPFEELEFRHEVSSYGLAALPVTW
ncbi:cytochrome P450 [Saccharomonospora viridis]|jgi:cytochrome P450|uniref:Cytochrome P450 n=2 Tax=Saccharomonospora viridis TaxID=1852 RepID=C7N0B0_SACVD|nr:cytochrome P450 [Saccharomonospora viridis]ACU98312.1 cytochrome P450 [Saccharomonospora viridis DSM 43017]